MEERGRKRGSIEERGRKEEDGRGEGEGAWKRVEGREGG